MEIWKKIDGYENYSVSTKGRVRNDKNGSMLKGQVRKGYSHVMLYPDRKWYRVHRLVAEAFIPNPNNYPVINHKNEVKNDNRVSNLEWCTHEYNCNYGTRIEKIRKTHSNCKRCIVDGVEYHSLTEACKQNGFRVSSVKHAFWKGRKTYKGHSISYIT